MQSSKLVQTGFLFVSASSKVTSMFWSNMASEMKAEKISDLSMMHGKSSMKASAFLLLRHSILVLLHVNELAFSRISVRFSFLKSVPGL